MGKSKYLVLVLHYENCCTNKAVERQGKTSIGLNRVVSCSYRTKVQLLLFVDRNYTNVTEQDKMFQIHYYCSETCSNLVPLHHLLLPEEALDSVPARDDLLKHAI